MNLELRNISKTFGNFKANEDISLKVNSGEVHSILGENGAGKSTLMKIIFGIQPPDYGGEILINNQLTQISSPKKAIELGIGMVHQHFKLIDNFTVLENIILGREPHNLFGQIDFKKARNEIELLLKTYNFDLNPNSTVQNLTVGNQQKIEILKALYRNAKLIIFDEPTAVLTPIEIINFYEIVRNLKKLGKTILIITHKLKEILEIADKCTIIRKGKLIETVDLNSNKTIDENHLAHLMVGRHVQFSVEKPFIEIGKAVLEIDKVTILDDQKIVKVDEISFQIKKGEILGIAGVDGNGQKELVEGLFGLRNVSSGKIIKENCNLTNSTPKKIYNSKISLIPEDRHKHGLILDFKVKENFILQKFSRSPFSKYGFLISSEIQKFSQKLMNNFNISPNSIEICAKHLSGGNQQKIIIARELENDPDILIAFQPTRGLDVRAIEFIHNELFKFKMQNKSILLISYELDEIINLSDRILVLTNGKIANTFDNTNSSESKTLKEKLGKAMMGGQK